MAENRNERGFGGMLRDVAGSIGELFGAGRLDQDERLHLEVTFGLLGLLARADSIVTSHETEFVNGLMDELALSNTGREIAFSAFESGRKQQITLGAEVKRFLAVHPSGSTEGLKLYDSLLRLAAADERLRPRERQFLEELTAALGYPPDMLEMRLKVFGGSL